MFAATYFATDTWLDVGRVDSLFLALSIGGLYAARHMRGTRGAIGAGVLLAAAALTKQTGLVEGVTVIVALFLPVAGGRVRPKYVWLPRGGGSCATAVSNLNGTARESRP